jgi:hypothetical protein
MIIYIIIININKQEVKDIEKKFKRKKNKKIKRIKNKTHLKNHFI